MTNEEIAGWMIRHVGPEAEPIFQVADAAYDELRRHETLANASAGRRAILELLIIVHGGLPVIERMRHAV